MTTGERIYKEGGDKSVEEMREYVEAALASEVYSHKLYALYGRQMRRSKSGQEADMSDILNRQAPVGSTRSTLALFGFLAACFAVAGLGSVITASQTIPGGWYETLEKPFFNPPSWLFGPVWTILYFIIAVSGWLVWRRSGFSGARVAMFLYFGQLTLNFLWTALFFGLQDPGLALIEILFLWSAILLTALAFRPLSWLAAVLLLPYLVWVTFAAVLNAAIWWLN